MRQKFGQNFLVDKNITQQIISAAQLSKDDTVIEIGPGRGILTELIYPLVKELLTVEIDSRLALKLAERFKKIPNVRILNQDFLDYDTSISSSHVKYISNLPYNVGTVILEKILPQKNWDTAVFMLQKEVGERIIGQTGTKDYGAFSIFCQYFAQTIKIADVKPESFSPKPKVSSVVLLFKNKFQEFPEPGLFWLIKHAFQQRRKTIVNSLSSTMNCPKEIILQSLKQLNINPMLRPEKLTISEYEILTLNLKKYIIFETIDKIW